MKQVNKDYISVVRSNSGRLLFERIPMIKSDRVKDKLADFLDDDRATIEDMLEYLEVSQQKLKELEDYDVNREKLRER